MNILYLDWPCFNKVDTLLTLEEMGHNVVPFFHADYQLHRSAAFDEAFTQIVDSHQIQCCFSYNYYPVVASNCHKLDIKYISFVYDSPFVMLYSYTLIYPTNYVFLFDQMQYLEFHNAGINTVYYQILPVNGEIIDTLLKKPYDYQRLHADVSFVGALYHESHNFYDRITGKNQYLDGYLQGIMDAQRQISGYSFVEEALTPSIIQMLQEIVPYEADPDSVVQPSYIYANYYINRKITQLERMELLTLLGQHTPVKLFTLDDTSTIPGVTNMGICDYYSEMPYLFYNSKINLNITLRSITSGIPLRCMDIMGNGGFLLSNYQSDLAEAFVPGEEFVYYEDGDDLVEKVDYYLHHEKHRIEIAENGHEKVKKLYNYPKVFEHIFAIAFSTERR